MSTLESGPKLDWTRDNQMFLRYKKWRSKIELIFRSALSKATPEEKTTYLKYWMGDEGLPLIKKMGIYRKARLLQFKCNSSQRRWKIQTPLQWLQARNLLESSRRRIQTQG